MSRSRAIYVPVSLLLLALCHWQARLIESGRAEGLEAVHQTTNLLFDLILGGLIKIVGAGAAQRIAISLAVLTFVWGAFAFVSAVSGRRAWHLMPVIAMLAYSWVFHMGLFSLYLSLGLCFWVLALAWEWKPWRRAAAAPILALAYLAHTLPVFWTAGLLAYLWLAGRTAPRTLAWLVAVSLPAMIVLRELVDPKFISEWSLQRVFMTSGTNTSWTFDAKYSVVLVGLLLVWGTMFLELLHHWGMRRVVSSSSFQLCVVGSAGVFALPVALAIPGSHHALAYISEPMALGVAVCICALLGAARPRMLERYALEDRMQGVVAQSAPGHGVVIRGVKAGISCGSTNWRAFEDRRPHT